MALTPQQQQLADVAQAGEANACCLAMGGQISNYPVTGEEICVQSNNMAFPLPEACQRVQAMLPSETETPGSEQNGNFYENYVSPIGTWIDENTEGIFNLFNPNPTPPPPGYQATFVPTSQNEDKTVLYIVVVAVLLLVGFLLYRKMKK